MYQAIEYVAIGERDYAGRATCRYCGEQMRHGFPTNYPQVCHDCADEYVWHYCDRLNQQPTTGTKEPTT